MPDQRITELGALAAAGIADGDQFVLVDVSDSSMAASGTDKKIAKSELDLVWLPRSLVSTLGLDLIDSATAGDARAVIGTDAAGVARPPTAHRATHEVGGGDEVRLRELTDVDKAGIANGEYLKWDSGAGKVTGDTPAGGTDLTPVRDVLLRASGRGSVSAVGGTVYMCGTPNTTGDNTSIAYTAAAGNAVYLLDVLAADLAVVAGKAPRLRVRAHVLCSTTFTVNVSVSLAAASFAGTSVSPGLEVTDSVATINTPTAGQHNPGLSAAFAPPADGLYVVRYTVSGTPQSNFIVHASILREYV